MTKCTLVKFANKTSETIIKYYGKEFVASVFSLVDFVYYR